MAEYIDREAAIKAIYDSDHNGIRRTLGFNVGQIEEALWAVPAVSVPQWISIKDRLPEDQEEVLVCTRSKNGVRNIDKGYMAIDRFIHRGRAEVTHWMPLPEPPKGE